MQGIADSAQHKGIIPRAFEHIFEAIETSDNVKYLVHASYLEIYNEEIRDLLGKDVKKRLELKEHPERGVYVCGKLHSIPVKAGESSVQKQFFIKASADWTMVESYWFRW